MKARGAGWARACAASLLATVVASTAIARAAAPEALVLGLHSDEGSACLSAQGLASALGARLGTPVSTASGDATLSVLVTVRTLGPRRFAVVIESHDRASDARGRRELTVHDECEALAAPLSLVIALMIGPQAAEEAPPTQEPDPAKAPEPEPAPAPEPTPEPAPAAEPALAAASAPATPVAAPPSPAPSRAELDDKSPTRFELAFGGGAGLGVLPRSTAVLQIAGRMRWVPAASSERGTPLIAELAIELWPPLALERGDAELNVVGATLGSVLCSAWSYGDVSFEPCAGLWLRPLHGSAPDTPVESEWFLRSGWSARGTVRLALVRAWSLFLGAQAVLPFRPTALALEAPAPRPERDEGPFFNATNGASRAPTRIVLHEPPIVGAVLVAGVTLDLGP